MATQVHVHSARDRDAILFVAIALALGQVMLACALPAARIWGIARFALAVACFPPLTLRLAGLLVGMTRALTRRVARRVHEPTAVARGGQRSEVCPIVSTANTTAPPSRFPGKNRGTRTAAGLTTTPRGHR